MSRGVVGAENGTLAVMVGGDGRRAGARGPVLDQLASDIVHVGGVGAGQVTKLCNNMLTAIITTALGEVLVTGVKAGVELEPLTAALGAGSAGNFVLSGYLPNTLFTDGARHGFALALMRKDLGLFMKAAGDAGLELPLSELVHERYVTRAAAGLDEADSTSIAELYERAAGVRLQLEPVDCGGGRSAPSSAPSPAESRAGMLIGGEWVDGRGRAADRRREPVAARDAGAASPAAARRTSTARSPPRRRLSGLARAARRATAGCC